MKAANDISDGMYPGMSWVPDNLPDVMQVMELAKEAAETLQMDAGTICELELESGYPWGREDAKFTAKQHLPRLDTVSARLVNEDIYGDEVKHVLARRKWADCEGEMEELLKLVRLTEKENEADERKFEESLDSVDEADPPANLIANSNGTHVQEPTNNAPPKDKEGSKTTNESATKAKATEKQAARQHPAKKITNRQNRSAIRAKTGERSPKEKREQKIAAQAARKSKAAEEKAAKIAADKEKLVGSSKQDSAALTSSPMPDGGSTTAHKKPGSKKHTIAHELELPEMKKFRRMFKSKEETTADFLAKLECLSGRLRRRMMARDMVMEWHKA